MSKRESIKVTNASIKEAILAKLKQLHYIEDYKLEIDEKNKYIKKFVITLAYKNGMGAVTDVALMSKPGRRFYVSYKDLKPVIGGMGCSILSTSKGIMTNYEARKAKLGGELLFNLW